MQELRMLYSRDALSHPIHAFDLADSVATVDDDVGTGAVRASIGGEVDVGTLELSSLRITAHGDHAVPKILSLLVNEVGETSIDVTRRDRVDTGEVAPFVGERLGQVDAASLCNVV
jgi:hypothetical protein